MSLPSRPVPELNAQRREAVAMRLQGRTLAQISRHTGLSAPTIIAAHKAYDAGGWDAVDTGPRGRPAAGGEILTPELEARLFEVLLAGAPDTAVAPHALWSAQAASAWLSHQRDPAADDASIDKAVSRWLRRHGLLMPSPLQAIRGSRPGARHTWLETTYAALQRRTRTEPAQLYWASEHRLSGSAQANARHHLLCAHTARGTQYWLPTRGWPTAAHWIDFFERLARQAGDKVVLVLGNRQVERNPQVGDWLRRNSVRFELVHPPVDAPAHASSDTNPASRAPRRRPSDPSSTMTLTHLQRLEAESIHIMREVVAEADNPVMLYSIGKDSAVMLHLARKAFFPAVPPFPLLHVDTRWKFRDMYRFRDQMVAECGMKLLVHINPEGVAKDINPFTHGSALHTDIMKTEALKQALDHYGFDVAFGGARRDEEKSRAKERVFSFRSAQHRWDPKNQRPELWKLYNARKHKGESIRVFPLSNWTELDIWQYIHLENVPIVPLYRAAERPVVERDGTLIMVDDDRMPLKPGEIPMMRKVRFRTLGCYPLTGAIESEADTLPAIIREMLLARTSERQGRVIDHDSTASMEKKKQEGYF